MEGGGGDLVEVEHGQLDLLVLVLQLLGLGVRLLLALLGPSQQPQQHVHAGVVRHACLGQAGVVGQLPGAKHQPLVLDGHPCKEGKPSKTMKDGCEGIWSPCINIRVGSSFLLLIWVGSFEGLKVMQLRFLPAVGY